ncbi:MAG: hypothetical protein RQ754_02870 [Desulfuromonadales bacterium]|nr:hypothetical protein [Desulfuromonadales bacterium]
MKRRATRPIFVEGALRAKGEVFEASRAWKHTEPADAKQEKKADAKQDAFDRKGAMSELTAAGVEFKGNISNDDLKDLLEKTRKELAPASSGAPSKEQGTGDQDVI